MSYNLSNGDESMDFNIMSWGYLLELAIHYGWTPMGTKKLDDDNWDGGYTSNDWQTVEPDDAIDLAKAIEKALEDISALKQEPTDPLYFYVPTEGGVEAVLTEILSPSNRGLEVNELLKKFSGENKIEYLKRFIAFCYSGKGFTIS